MPAQSPHLVFCTPERLATASFLKQLQSWHAARPFAYIVVDEAHLVAEQGHTFRPDYLRLGELRAALPDLAMLCFSATCNEFVRQCLSRVLALRSPRLFDADTSLVSKLCTTLEAKVILLEAFYAAVLQKYTFWSSLPILTACQHSRPQTRHHPVALSWPQRAVFMLHVGARS